ncbi:LAGLIDADG family homing endonuclease [Natronomonas aquatica]|nr:LAGLIDADG family homing endonuclease [Natronomonas aquatica]
MARAEDTEIIDKFEQFYRDYYRNEIGQLAQKYPNEKRSLYIEWDDLYRFDPDIADDFIAQPDQMREYAEEALRLYDLPVDVKLGQAHVRVRGLQRTTGIREIRARHRGQLVEVTGIIRKATDVRPKVTEAAFECQRCGTLSRIPQTSGEFYEPHECQGCERQGPFEINFDQSEFVDAQKLRVQESPEGLRGGETPQSIDVHIDDDITGQVTAGDHVRVTGILHLDQQGSNQEKSPVFDVYMDGLSVEIEDEQFEDMDITDEDKKRIIELSNESDIYEKMIGSMAPSIYGYEQEKLAIIMQLFSGVTKHLPDGSRTRGDLHMLLIGDPGTGKCQKFDTKVTLSNGTEKKIGEIVEENLEDPIPVDDGFYQKCSIPVLTTDGQRIASGTATKLWKRQAPDQMYNIRTASGRELEVTPSHPLFTQTKGELGPTTASKLREDDFIAIPATIPNAPDESIDVQYDLSESPNPNELNAPTTLTDQLARLIGYTVGEGHISGGESSRQLTITNADDEILDDVCSIIENLGLRYQRKPHYTNSSVSTVICSSVELARFLEALEPNLLERSAQQCVPDVVFRATPQRKAEFLRAYVDGECSVSATQREITIASMSEELLENVRSLLLSFGIQSQLHPRNNGSYRLRIGGADFERYVDRIGFVTERKALSAAEFDDVETNTNTGVVPNVGDTLREIRESLAISQFDCGVPRTTYQHYERGDRNPGRSSLRTVLDAFEARIERLSALRERVTDEKWDAILTARDELNISQAALADGMDVSQTAISYYERNEAVPDGGRVMDAQGVVLQRLDAALSAEDDVDRLRTLADGDIAWDRIESIEALEPDYEWVYDLEVEGTHSYISNNVISHNSQLLQYVRNLAPRSVYTSGKGSSSAGLCVTGDTTIHTEKGFKPIRELVTSELPDPVSTETAVEKAIGVRTFDRERGEVVDADSSHLWRMPERPCRRIETQHGKELEASTQTPVLVCGPDGIEWREISEIEAGDHVGVPTDGDSIETVDAELRWDEVVRAEDIGSKEVFDLTVPDTHNFVGNGIVTHNTAAAVRDDFGDGQQWTLEAGALVLADQGIAAVDELDKMRCVTGDTLVQLADGRTRRISQLAEEALEEGTVESIENGRTIRGVDFDVRTMTENNRLIDRPVTAVHEYEAPSELVEVLLESGESVITTPDHPFFVHEADGRFERGAEELRTGDRVFVPESNTGIKTDGGTVSKNGLRTSSESETAALCRVAGTTRIENEDQWSSVYDLTVEGTHNFVANGMVVHNSEDRSAMHEALEQQSYHPDTEILLSDGRRVDIGEFVDERMQRNPDRVTDGVDCEILPVDDVGIHSVDLEDTETTKLPIDRVSRHEAPEEFVRVTFSNGRKVTVTPEHPMFVDDGGEVGTVEARAIEEGAFVPAPRKLPNSSAAVELDGEPHVGKEKDVHLPAELTEDLAEVLGFLVAEGHSYAGSAHEIGFSNQDERLLERMDRLMASVFGMESTDTTNAAGTVTKRWVSTKLYRWFERNFPGFMHTAREKRIPDRVLGASEEEIRRFLVGAFAGDGGVESEAMAFSTASDGLARDYADALSKIGVGSRIHHDTAEDSWKVYVMGDSTERFVEAVVESADERYEDAMVFVENSTDDAEDHSSLRYYRVRDVETVPNYGENACEWVYDVTVEPTNTFVSQGVVLHNSISISKAGINATLKSRCSLLGAANPKYGRFDQYESIGEQIDLEPALISRFDLIFTVTDQPDEEEDANLAEHIINTNYAGELHTHRENTTTSDVSQEEVENVTEKVEPAIDAELLRKYIAHAKRNCYPMMSEEAKAQIRDFYVDLRSKGQGEDAPVPVTARKLEALVRLSEASARMRLSDTVEREDAERVIDIVRSCLQDIGVDPETGEFDADVVETGTSKSQRDRIKNIKALISEIEAEYDEGAPVETVLDRAEEMGMERSQAEHEIEKLRRQGDVYEPTTDHLRTV